MISSSSLVEYMQLADQILQQEKRKFSTYLTWDKIDQKIVSEFQEKVLLRY